VNYELPAEAEQCLRPIQKGFESCDKRHRNYRTTWNRLYSLYRAHSDFRQSYKTASEPDRDVMLKDMQRQVGEPLFIPHAFEVVEVVSPRTVANLPKMLIKPRGGTPEEAVEGMGWLIDSQQEQAGYELTSQETVKSGLTFGLGVEKHSWRYEMSEVPVLERGIKHPLVETTALRGWDDPDAESIDIFDFFWDPFAADVRRMRWAIHRVWRDTDYVVKKLITGEWNNPYAFPPSEVANCGPTGEYDSIHRQRLEAAGMEQFDSRDDQRHEIWEHHNGKDVTIVLNRKYPLHKGSIVGVGVPGRLPFTAYRPTTQGIKELPGIGEIEMIEQLNYEMNDLRTARRDNARMVVNRSFFYQDGTIDPDTVAMGPGLMVPTLGDPRELLYPFPVEDLPQSGYAEEDRLLANIQRVSGISDDISGAAQTQNTATGAQLVNAAVNVRIQNKARRYLKECAADGANLWILMNQNRVRTNRTLSIPAVPQFGQPARRWAQVVLRPEELAGDMFAVGDGDSTMPDNVPQQRQDAQMLNQLYRGQPEIDQRQLMLRSLRLMGIKDPERWMAPEGPKAQFMLMVLEQMGMPREEIAQIAEAAEMLEQNGGEQARGAQPSTGDGPPAPEEEAA
jgi:hypothetical protein